MELEEMKVLWSEMSEKIEHQRTLTDNLILKMTQEKYSRRIKKISFYETVGTAVCFGMTLYLLFNFDMLDTWYLQLCGAITVAILVVLPMMVLSSIHRLKNLSVVAIDFKFMLTDFIKCKQSFLRIQRLSLAISSVLVVTILPVTAKIMKGKDVFIEQDLSTWITSMVFLFAFLLVFGTWGYTKYTKLLHSTEEMLRELDE